MNNRSKSQALFERAIVHLAGGVNSPVRAFRAVGGTPLYIERGEGAYLYDVDGGRFLDFCCSWGPLILGHAHPDIVEAINHTAARGTSFGTVHENEVLLAEKIAGLCPHIEMLRFVSSGTEAVMSAVRLARGFTNRDKIVKFSGCYHGHSDYLLASAGSGLVTFGIPSSAGVPEDFTKHTLVAPLNDIDAVEKLFSQHGTEIAAVIIEPVPANNGLLLQSKEYLEFLRRITSVNGALLIFDEVISGFRVAPGGAAQYYGITPDICTYGKVIGGGLPVGAFGGRSEIMHLLAPEGPIYQAGTLSGNPLALACGLATLDYLEKHNGWKMLEERTRAFTGSLREKTSELPINVVSIGSIFWINLQPQIVSRAEEISSEGTKKYAKVFNAALAAGIYLAPSAYEVGFVSTAHGADDLSSAAERLAGILTSSLV
ncbi:MAG: glutamate-1-semialdehyde 2,1-aminomutase [Candidatus Zixiibacteriota bacterium]|nr:MAG: glutamate-1-semialdehyde 2,1-aminomutase [candidate division Zixibacteria bacterium]